MDQRRRITTSRTVHAPNMIREVLMDVAISRHAGPHALYAASRTIQFEESQMLMAKSSLSNARPQMGAYEVVQLESIAIEADERALA